MAFRTRYGRSPSRAKHGRSSPRAGPRRPAGSSSEIVFSGAHALARAVSQTRACGVSAPEGRAGHVAVYDPVNDRMPVFGGIRGHNLPAPPTVLSLNFGASLAQPVDAAQAW